MTSPGINKPESSSDVYDDVHSRGSSFGQDLKNKDVRSMLVGRQTSSFLNVGSIFGGVIEKIGQALMGITQGGMFSFIDEASQRFIDGQEALNDRTDLLSPLLDYGSAYVHPDNRVHGTGYAVFSEQIGPMRGCELITDSQGGIRLLDKGLWDIRVHLTADGILQLLSSAPFRFELRIFSPTGTLFSRQVFHGNDADPITGTIVSSVVVPEAGYRARVYLTKMGSLRGILGGPAWSRLAVQHIARDVDGAWSKGNETSTPEPE